MARKSILVVDDEKPQRDILQEILTSAGYDVTSAASGEAALKFAKERSFDLALTDLKMTGMDGIELLQQLLALDSSIIVLLLTAHGTIDSAKDALRRGAFDYLQKPFERDALLGTIKRALGNLDKIDVEIISASPKMEAVKKMILKVARSSSTVLVRGESGTGKELIARAIHDRSAQRDMPLIKVNCAAIPETLLESELFGHVRGAFTGASTTKKGKFALADGGTIFLDEIGTMSPTLQSKLLRVLQEREVEPLGSERTEKIDVRVIAATNRDLHQMVADGKFQEDLFYRLNVIPIEIPPLRERRDDIPALVEHFVKKHAQRTGRRFDKLDETVLTGLQQYDWPGNVRELENTIERAVVLSPGPVISSRAVSVLGGPAQQPAGLPSMKLRQNIEWVERETIRRSLENAGGVKKDAAELMGISQRALSYYLAKYRLES
jgi:DNA-binding NtrC family response regulator